VQTIRPRCEDAALDLRRPMRFPDRDTRVVGPCPADRAAIARLGRDREHEATLGESLQVHKRCDRCTPFGLQTLTVELHARAHPCHAWQLAHADRELAPADALFRRRQTEGRRRRYRLGRRPRFGFGGRPGRCDRCRDSRRRTARRCASLRLNVWPCATAAVPDC
jgi:hypothetical protein